MSIELWKQEWKFGRTRNVLEYDPAGTDDIFSIWFGKSRDVKKKKCEFSSIAQSLSIRRQLLLVLCILHRVKEHEYKVARYSF